MTKQPKEVRRRIRWGGRPTQRRNPPCHYDIDDLPTRRHVDTFTLRYTLRRRRRLLLRRRDQCRGRQQRRASVSVFRFPWERKKDEGRFFLFHHHLHISCDDASLFLSCTSLAAGIACRVSALGGVCWFATKPSDFYSAVGEPQEDLSSAAESGAVERATKNLL